MRRPPGSTAKTTTAGCGPARLLRTRLHRLYSEIPRGSRSAPAAGKKNSTKPARWRTSWSPSLLTAGARNARAQAMELPAGAVVAAIEVPVAGIVLAARIPVPTARHALSSAAALGQVADQRGGGTGLVVAAALVQGTARLAGPRVGGGVADAHRIGGGAGAVVGDAAAGPVERAACDARSGRRVSWSCADQAASAAELGVGVPVVRTQHSAPAVPQLPASDEQPPAVHTPPTPPPQDSPWSMHSTRSLPMATQQPPLLHVPPAQHACPPAPQLRGPSIAGASRVSVGSGTSRGTSNRFTSRLPSIAPPAPPPPSMRPPVPPPSMRPPVPPAASIAPPPPSMRPPAPAAPSIAPPAPVLPPVPGPPSSRAPPAPPPSLPPVLTTPPAPVVPPLASSEPSSFLTVPLSPQPTAPSATMAAHAIHARGASTTETNLRVFMQCPPVKVENLTTTGLETYQRPQLHP